jgi:hypothetical protein
MRKLKLEIDALSVQSFATTAPDAPRRGTVRAAEGTVVTACGTCVGETCEGPTCFTSCGFGPPDCVCPPPGTTDP